MTPTIALIIAALVMAVALFAFALARISAQADRDARCAHLDYMMGPDRYGSPCVRCGEPTAFALDDWTRTPIHPGCREGQ